MTNPRVAAVDPQIVDVIAQKNPYCDHVHYFVIVDQPVRYVYTPSPTTDADREISIDLGMTYFLGRCGDFRDYLAGTSRKGEAFGGRSFDINLIDGSRFHCAGDVWACCRRRSEPETVSVGVATIAELADCNVFCSGHILRETLEAWLAVNTPSDDYYKYDERRKWFATVLPTLRVLRNAKRRRRLRRRGEDVWFEKRIGAWVWKMRASA